MSTRTSLAAVLALAGGLLVATPASAAEPSPWSVDLRADTNRDGTVDVTGSSDQAATSPALVLPNLDDDSNRCVEKLKSGEPVPYADLDLCKDSSDTVVNGSADALDLAPVQLLPAGDVPDDAVGALAITGKANLFLQTAGRWRRVRPETRLTAEQLRAGVVLGVEATAPRSKAFNGEILVTLTARSAAGNTSDTVRLETAPLLTQHHLQAAHKVLVADPLMRVSKTKRELDQWQVGFNRRLRREVRAAGVAGGVRELGDEMWQQDYVEPLYACAPRGSGSQCLRVLLRSDQGRTTQRALYALRGRDLGVLWLGKPIRYSTLNSFGNLETIPPYAGHPAGRVIIGAQPAKDDQPSGRVLDLIAAQGAGQDALVLDTSFLGVGHVDEFVQFVPADTARGWKIAIADPRAALAIIRKAKAAGHGDAEVNPLNPLAKKQRTAYVKKYPKAARAWPAPLTVDQALRPGPRGLVLGNEFAAKVIDANLAKLLAATGASEADVIRVPVAYQGARMLWRKGPKKGQLKTWDMGSLLPDAINNLVLGKTLVVAQQNGLRIGGRSVFADAVRDTYAAHGLTVRYVDDRNYFAGGGDVHCGTNTLRLMTPLF